VTAAEIGARNCAEQAELGFAELGGDAQPLGIAAEVAVLPRKAVAPKPRLVLYCTRRPTERGSRSTSANL